MGMEANERRRFDRVEVRQFGKIYDPRSRKYVPCMTCNVSHGGIMVEVARPLHFQQGDRLLIGLAMGAHPAILRSSELFEAEVVRALNTTDGRQGIALRIVQTDRETIDALSLAA